MDALQEAQPSPSTTPATDGYQQRALVSDGTISAAHHDPNLVNAWGLAFNPDGFAWVNDNGTGVATLYDGQGNPQSLVVTLPTVGGGSEFVISGNGQSAPARFIFATEDGTISAWAPSVDQTHAVLVADESGAPLGPLKRPAGSNVHADGLWALAFGNGLKDQPTSTLFFTAGPDEESHGLYGRIDPVSCGGFPAPARERSLSRRRAVQGSRLRPRRFLRGARRERI